MVIKTFLFSVLETKQGLFMSKYCYLNFKKCLKNVSHCITYGELPHNQETVASIFVIVISWNVIINAYNSKFLLTVLSWFIEGY